MALRIEILFDQGTVRSMKIGTLQVLHHEIERRLSGDWPNPPSEHPKSGRNSGGVQVLLFP